MKKSIELLRQKNALKGEITNLQKEGKINDAHGKLAELENLNKELEIQLTLEASEESAVAGIGTEVVSVEDVNPMVVFNKQVLGMALTDAEAAYVANAVGTPGQAEHTPGKGGYLVPEQSEQTIKEFRRGKIALKDYVNVIPVGTMSGKFPVGTDQNGTLTSFEELNEIVQSDITFVQQNWSVLDYGDIIPISNTLLEDTTIDLMKYVGGQFTKKAINTENAQIYALMKSASAKKTGTEYKAIKTALNKDLDPSIASTARVYTNQSGFDWLDNLEDENKRPLLTVSLTDPSKKLFSGKEIIVLPDALMAQTSGKYGFYVGDLSEAVNFYDRKGVEVAVSKEAGFTKNATLMRVVERFDVKSFDTAAVVYVEITPPVTP